MTLRAGQVERPRCASCLGRHEKEMESLRALVRERDLQLEVARGQVDMLRNALRRLIPIWERLDA